LADVQVIQIKTIMKPQSAKAELACPKMSSNDDDTINKNMPRWVRTGWQGMISQGKIA